MPDPIQVAAAAATLSPAEATAPQAPSDQAHLQWHAQCRFQCRSQCPVQGQSQGQSQRHVFWRTYRDWLARATWRELEQLETVLADHAPHVRPIHLAIGDALADRRGAQLLPTSLIDALENAGWIARDRPSPPTPAAHALAGTAARRLPADSSAKRA